MVLSWCLYNDIYFPVLFLMENLLVPASILEVSQLRRKVVRNRKSLHGKRCQDDQGQGLLVRKHDVVGQTGVKEGVTDHLLHTLPSDDHPAEPKVGSMTSCPWLRREVLIQNQENESCSPASGHLPYLQEQPLVPVHIFLVVDIFGEENIEEFDTSEEVDDTFSISIQEGLSNLSPLNQQELEQAVLFSGNIFEMQLIM